MDKSHPTIVEVILKTIVTHTVTYFIMGLIDSTVFEYGRLYPEMSLYLSMRQLGAPLALAGPLFQPIRGILFGIVFFLLRDMLFGRKKGWLVMWITLVVVGIIGPFGSAPGSIEGMAYTTLPIEFHLTILSEALLQALILSALLFYWVNHPEKKWLNWVMGIVFILWIMGMVFILMSLPPTLGLSVG